jgi:asparagine synthase (glutamine-hydrolysing)
MTPFVAIIGTRGNTFSPQPETRGPFTLVSDARIDEGGSILDAYETWGEACVDHLAGDFSFAIRDATRDRLFCARDFMGIRQLYYARTANELIVASSISPIIRHPGISDALEESSIAKFLIGGTSEFPVDTFYPRIKRLPPAHMLTWDGERLVIRRYWSLPLDGAIRYRDRRDYVAHFREVFDRAVADRLRGAGSAAAMMSGGLDSTAVSVTAQRALATPLHAYTTSFAKMLDDKEASWAARVANAGGMIHRVFAGDDCELFEDETSYRRAEPFEDPLASVFLGLVRDAAQHAPVMLAGEGGDVLFYTSHGHFPGLLRHGRLLRFGSDIASYTWRNHHLPPLNLRAVVKNWFGAKPRRAVFPSWIREDVARRFSLREQFQSESDIGELHPVRPEAHRALMQPFWQRLFETWDPSESGIPIRIVYPFFDRRLVELLFAFPPMPGFAGKYLLREAMKGRLPEEVRRRPKTPMAGDPLRIVMRRSTGRLRDILEAVPEMTDLIDSRKLLDYLDMDQSDGCSDLLAAFPFCLAKWWSARKATKTDIADAFVGSSADRS